MHRCLRYKKFDAIKINLNPMGRKLFFNTTIAVAERLTETLDFVWSTATAQWNLRWQVDGFIRANPAASDDDLRNRFALGSGIRGANIRRSCIDTSWDLQQEMFARLLLIEFCALFEAWIEGTLELMGHNSRHSKNLQFPTTATGGVGVALAFLLSNPSLELGNSIYPTLRTNRKNSFSKIDNLLVCYRFFKECRNSLIHHGGAATQKTLDAYNSFDLETTASLGVSEVPQHYPLISVGDQIQLSLRGVVGFGEIVLKLVTTLDCELSKTAEAEDIFAQRWKEINGAHYHLPQGSQQQENRIIRLVRKLGLEKPANPLGLIPMLRRRNLVAAI